MTVLQSISDDARIKPRVEVGHVDLTNPDARREWDAFIEAHPDATFFHRAGWPHVIQSVYGHENVSIAARMGGRIVGVLPLTHVRSPLFGSALVSTAFTVGGGVIAETEEIADKLAESAALIGAERGVEYVELRSALRSFDGWRPKSDLYAGFVKDIPEDEDANLKMIPRKKRADLRKALKSGLVADAHADVSEFYALYSESLRNLGTPVFPRKLIEALKRAFEDDMEISVIRAGAQPLAALVTFFFRDAALPYYGGASPAARNAHAYDYQYWALMRRAIARGASKFDFGRSKVDTGAYAYKKYWGFEPQPLTYQYHLIRAKSTPEINPLNPKYRAMVAIWRRLPLAAANAIGPHIARQLG
ncbi:MAG: FemAB family PEP-CTERM system-associated protein [Parvularculaceae bacterium]